MNQKAWLFVKEIKEIMMKSQILTIVFALVCAATGMAQTDASNDFSASYENTQGKADRFFDHQEWASAAAMYNFMLQQRPKVPDTYGRAIVATEMLGDTLRSMTLLSDAMHHGVSLDSVLTNVQKYSFQIDEGHLYEHFMLQAVVNNPWMERPLDAYLLRYYMFRRNGPQIIVYAKKMLGGAPDNQEYQLDLADGYLQDGQTAQAVEVWRRIAEGENPNYEAPLQLGNYYNLTGDRHQAHEYLERAYRLKPTPYVEAQLHRLNDRH